MNTDTSTRANACPRAKSSILLFLLLLVVRGSVCAAQERTPLWEYTYTPVAHHAGANPYWLGYYLTQTSDGGFLICGDLYDGSVTNMNSMIGILKTSSAGIELWRQKLGGDHQNMGGKLVYEHPETSTYEFLGCWSYSAGVSAGLTYFMELSAATGDTIASRYTYAAEGATRGIPIAKVVSDSSVILAAPVMLGEGQNKSALLAKADRQGKKYWEKRFDLPYEGLLGVNEVLVLPDGGYIFYGYNYPLSGTTSATFLIRTDSEGELLWRRDYNTGGFDISTDFKQTADGGFLLLANRYLSNPARRVIHLIKVDEQGEQLWDRFIEQPEIVNGNTLLVHPSGGVFIAGYTARYANREIGKMDEDSPDFYLVRTTSDGAVEWEEHYGSDSSDILDHIIATSDGGIAVTGRSHRSLYLAAFTAETITTVRDKESISSPALLVAPNPVSQSSEVHYVVSSSGVVELSLSDVQGREVSVLYSGFRQAGSYTLSIDRHRYCSGMYYLRYTHADRVHVEPLFIE